MLKIQQNTSLKKYNTFGIEAAASRFVSINSEEELLQVLKNYKDIFVISGGSNMLLTENINKTVVHINTKGVIVELLNEETSLVTAQAGENWHEFVQWCVENSFGGLENLSLIPGKVGASPIQNIGAYGVEIKDCFEKLEAVEIATLKKRIFTKEECNFGYRNSVFKNELKGKYIILNVTFKLTTKNHRLHIDYGAIKNQLQQIESPTIKDVSNAVIAIRQAKLPDPKKIGNSGSFFKNPIVDKNLFKKIQSNYKQMPFYAISKNEFKIPAGWMIEQCGFKGKRFKDAGIHSKQALVLVNYGNTTGKEMYQLAKKVQKEVQKKFSIVLEIEVNVIK